MKSKFDVMLEYAGWPTVLVEESGELAYANEAAAEVFGPAIKEARTPLAGFWSAENPESVPQFLSRLDRTNTAVKPLRLQVKEGKSSLFKAYIRPHTREGKRCYIMQLFSHHAPAAHLKSLPAAPSPSPAPAPGVPTPIPVPPAVEVGAAQRQKLDCAMQLIRSVVLDFNNALTTILGHTSLLLGNLEANHPWRRSLLDIEKSAERAAEIANDLAAFSRPEKESRAGSAGNLNDLLRRTIDLAHAPGDLALEWRLQLEPKPLAAVFDEAKMQQVFLKIFENSIQACRAPARIAVSTRNTVIDTPTQDGIATVAPGHYLCIDVADNGNGIAPDVLPRIFEPFFTTKPNHRGLGLAWVYGVVTNHGGSVTVSSRPGAETLVRIYLPAIKKYAREKPVGGEDLSGHQTVLCVDDEPLVLSLAELVLSSQGYRVITATSGEKALEAIGQRTGPIELVISDLVMPGMGGREFIERAQRLLPGARFLRCSGYARASGGEEDEGFLRKPFTSQELLSAAKRALAVEGGS